MKPYVIYRIPALFLCFLLLFSLFAGCGRKEDTNSLSFMENSSIPEGAAKSGEFYYDVTHVELADYDEILSVIPQEDTTQLLCYNNSGSHLVTLDHENQIKSSVPTPIERARLVYHSGEQLISVAKTKNTEGVYRYHVYRDNQVLWEFPDLRNLEISQILEVDGTIYSYFKSTSDIPDENWLKDSIYINDYRLPIPEDTADGKRYKLYGISELNGVVYALLQEYQSTGPDSDPNLKQYFIPIDATTTSLTFPENYLDFYLTPGTTIGSPDGFLSVIGESVYCFTQEKMDEIFNIKLLGIDPIDVISISIGTDGSLYILQTGTFSIITLKFGTREYKEVVIGMIGLPSDTWSYHEDLIYNFNRQSGSHRARIKRYRSIENLNLAILSGEVDIVADWHVDTFINYTNKQLLTPLEDVIPELFEDGVLLDNVKASFETDGSWYYLPRSIEAQGLTMSKSLLNGRTEFSDIEEFVEFLGGLDPKVLKANSRTALLETILSLGMANWVDFETGTASFTDDSFLNLLEACNLCSPTYVDSQSYDQDNSISKFTSYRQHYSLSEIGDPEKGVSPKAAFAVPTPESSSMAITSSSFLAMLDNAPNPEGAKAFLREAFLNSEWPVRQINFITQRIFNRFHLDGVPIKAEEANTYFFSSSNSSDVALLTPVRDLTWAFHTSADHIIRGDVIMDIVNEEAASYFSGHISAEKAAEYIQNRVSIYLAEQS